MAKDMSNNDIVAYEGGDYGEIMDNYDLHEITAAIANRAGKAADTVRSLEQEVERLENNPDVVDIVATYADLQDYDTSQLTDKDIIRVLQDETHNDDSTYYRWSATAQSWTYIGESKQYTDFVGTDGTTAGTAGLVPAPATTDAGKFLKADGTWDDAGSAVNVVQTTGTSTTNVMSQNATSKMVFKDAANKRIVQIGSGASGGDEGGVTIGYNAKMYSGTGGTGALRNVVIGYGAVTYGGNNVTLGQDSQAGYTSAGNSTGNLAVGYNAKATAQSGTSTAIGSGAQSTGRGSVAIGAYSSATVQGTVSINTSVASLGYNSSNYRLLTGLYDGQSAHDAATYGQLDTRLGGLTLLKISQTDYDNLGTYDPNTLYVITGA